MTRTPLLCVSFLHCSNWHREDEGYSADVESLASAKSSSVVETATGGAISGTPSGESEEKEGAEARTADFAASQEEEENLLLDAVEKDYGAFNWDLEDDPDLMQKLKSS